MKIHYLAKIKIISVLLTSVLIIGIFSAVTRAGIIFINRENSDNYKKISKIIRDDKTMYNTILGDICDRNEDYILQNNDLIVDSTSDYDISYTYLLGSVKFDTTGILNTCYDTLTNTSKNKDNKGLGIRLTIDDTLQKQLYSLTEGSRKSIIIMEKNSGKILAMTSAYEESFNLSDITNEQLEAYNNAYEPVWLPEALNCYHTGSVMKIFTSAVAFDTGYGNFTMNDFGSVAFNGKTINDSYSADGELETIETAFVKSSNVYFSTLGVTIGTDTIKTYIERFLLDETIETDFGTVINKSDLKKNSNNFSIAEYCYGQEGSYSTITLCMLAQGALTGRIYRPHIIDSTFYYDEDDKMVTLEETSEEILSDNIVSQETCQSVDKIMKASANSKGLASDVGAKTGTAEIHLGNRATMIGTFDNYIIAISEISDGVLYGSSHTDTMQTITDILRQY